MRPTIPSLNPKLDFRVQNQIHLTAVLEQPDRDFDRLTLSSQKTVPVAKICAVQLPSDNPSLNRSPDPFADPPQTPSASPFADPTQTLTPDPFADPSQAPTDSSADPTTDSSSDSSSDSSTDSTTDSTTDLENQPAKSTTESTSSNIDSTESAIATGNVENATDQKNEVVSVPEQSSTSTHNQFADLLGFNPWYLIVIVVPILGFLCWRLLAGKELSPRQKQSPELGARGHFKKASRFTDPQFEISDSDIQGDNESEPAAKTTSATPSAAGSKNADSNYIVVAPSDLSKKVVVAKSKIDDEDIPDFDGIKISPIEDSDVSITQGDSAESIPDFTDDDVVLSFFQPNHLC